MRTTVLSRIAVIVTCLGSLTIPASFGAAARASAVTPLVERGINTYFTYNCQSASLISQWAHTEMNQYKALGANSVAIAFPLYTDSISSNNIYAKVICGNKSFQSPSPAVMGLVISAAKSAGLNVFERPALSSTNLTKLNPNYWAGVIKPNNPTKWFSNYLTTLKPYLAQAQSLGVSSFAISSELDSMSHKTQWSSTIAAASKIFTGKMVFNYSWNSGSGKASWSGTSTGIDAYPAVTNTPDSASPAVLLSKWNQLLNNAANYKLSSLSSITIDEVGLPAQSHVFTYPWLSNFSLSTHPFNQSTQANWFTTACNFAKSHQMKGIYFWGPWLADRAGNILTKPTSKYVNDIQPLAQSAIKACFSA